MTDTDWYAASLVEITDFLDKFHDHEIVAVYEDDVLLDALVSMLRASHVIYAAGVRAMNTVATMKLLECEAR